MKATRKLIPAIALLLVSAVLLSTASYAWFTTNKVVDATMSVGVTAPQNLQISKDGSAWSSAVEFNEFGTGAVLTPVSSKDGKSFVICRDLKLDQDGVFDSAALTALLADPTKGKVEEVAADSDAKGTYYVVNNFQLRASQAFAAGKLSLNVVIDADSSEAYRGAVRVLVYQHDGSDYKTLVYASEGSHKAIEKNAESFKVADTAYASSNTVSSLEFAAATAYMFQVIVWVEGNDPACVSANVDDATELDISLTFTLAE
jgi:hypothetical protein